jgi:tRNA(His) 5'-end guanylyltransferase
MERRSTPSLGTVRSRTIRSWLTPWTRQRSRCAKKLQDFSTIQTDAWFDGSIQKIVSIAASVVTTAFAHAYEQQGGLFDARVFTIPDPVEVENYFIWRQNDASRNSIQGLCQAHFSPRQLHGKGQREMHDLLHSISLNWNDCSTEQKRGRGIVYDNERWSVDREIPVWTKDREWLTSRIPRQWQADAAVVGE